MNIVFVPAGNPAVTAREFLAQQFPDLSSGHLAQLLKRGKFGRSGVPLVGESRLHPGDLITLPGNQAFQQQAVSGSPAILYEDSVTLVVNKPSMLAVHSSVGHQKDNLLLRLAATMRHRRAPYRLHPVHRLDKETSGALLLAKGKSAAGDYGKLLMGGQMGKSYLALVRGQLADQGVLETPLPIRGKLRSSQTAFRTLARKNGYSLLEVDLHSGRTHQVRRHLAAVGAPLAGDRRYGETSGNDEQFYLHCRRLSFPHPEGEQAVTVTAPLQEKMLTRLRQLGFTTHTAVPELELFARNLEQGLSIAPLSE